MKAHVLTQGQCRASPRRVSAGHRATGVTQRRPRPARHGSEVSPARTYAPPVCTATGFLIPRLSSTVPLAYEGQVPGSLGYIQALVKHGALTLTSEGATAEDLIEQGICALVHPGILKYEDQWSERLSVMVDEDGIGFVVGSDPHGWVMRLKPILARLTYAEAVAFIASLDDSVIQGPCFWDEMIVFAGGELFDQAESREQMGGDHIPASESLAADGEQAKLDAAGWLAQLFANNPALRGDEAGVEQLTLKHITPKRRPADHGLRALIRRFTQASAAIGDGLAGQCALMVTSWDKDCHLSHAHDFHGEQIHNGDWDTPDGAPFNRCCRDVEDFIRNINLAGEFIAAAQALEEWTNAHC